MIKEVLSYIKFLKIKDYEIYYTDYDSLSLTINRNKIDFVSEGKVSGLGIRLFIDGKLGFSSTTNIKNYKNCIDTAIKIARLSEKNKKFKSFMKEKGKSNIKAFDKRLLNFDIENAKEYVNNYISLIKNSNEKINISEGSYTKGISNIRIINSEGIDVNFLKASNAADAEIVMDNINIVSAQHETHPLDYKIGKEDVKRLLNLRNKKHVETKDMELLLHPEALTDIMNNSFEFSIDGENVNQKKSILYNKLNQSVFDKKLTIVDDGTTKGLLNTTPYDDEGKVTKNNIIVKKGILKNFLYDSYNGYLVGKKSTGNCSRSFNSMPNISPNNIIMEKGKSKDILSEVKEGLYVRSLIGTHTMDTTTGDFSLGVMEGHYIKNGEIKNAVIDCMIAGNFFKLMKDIKAMNNKLEHSSGYYVPKILFNKIKVIGK